jgi:hypothetical protein
MSTKPLGEQVGNMLFEQEDYRQRRIKREIEILDEREQRYGDRTTQIDISEYRQILLERLSLVQHVARLEMMLGYGRESWKLQPVIFDKKDTGGEIK